MKISGARVLVTGGAGFIGSHLVDRLLSAENEVVVLDDLSSGSLRNLAHAERDTRLRVERADVLDYPAVRKLMQGVSFVFHLATRNVRLSLRRPTEVHEVNVTGTLNVLKASAEERVTRFLYCSSSEVNGTADVVPMPEDYTFKPETIYGASKLAGEYYAQVFHRSHWLDTRIARCHNTYGPRSHYEGEKGEVIPRFILQALAAKPMTVYGDGSQTRDYTYVTETADFMVRLLECDEASGTTHNVCFGREVSILDLVSIIGDLTGSRIPPLFLGERPNDVKRLYGDNSRLMRTLGSVPRISIREGLALTVDWFRTNVAVSEDALTTVGNRNFEDVKSEEWLDALKASGRTVNASGPAAKST